MGQVVECVCAIGKAQQMVRIGYVLIHYIHPFIVEVYFFGVNQVEQS